MPTNLFTGSKRKVVWLYENHSTLALSCLPAKSNLVGARAFAFYLAGNSSWTTSKPARRAHHYAMSRFGVTIGDRVNLCSSSRFTALGVARPVILRTLSAGATLAIGKDSGLSGTTICAALSVRIGERCLLGADVMITDTDFHQLSPVGRRYSSEMNARTEPVEIEDDVFIGARVIILPGVRIGVGSVVGAGSVVTRDIPAYSVCVGNPARVIRNLEH